MFWTILLTLISAGLLIGSKIFKERAKTESTSSSRSNDGGYGSLSKILQYVGIGFTTLTVVVTLSSTVKSITTDGGYENVLTDKPYFFGHEGVREIPATSGRTWVWISTDNTPVEIRPIQHTEKFDDMTTKDNNYVDFVAYIRTRIEEGKSPLIYSKFGLDYYNKNIQQEFRNQCRDNTSKYTMTDLSARSTTTSEIQRTIEATMKAYVKAKGIPVIIEEINFGKILPNANVLAELNNTAAQQQRVQTEKK